MRRVFVKPRWGSSAAGALALAIRPSGVSVGPAAVGYSTVEIVRAEAGARFYSSRRVRTYRGERDLATIVDWLAREGAHVEEWLPKASVRGRLCDARVVAIAGEPMHAVLRLSRSPMTNLHLLNERADISELQQRVAPDVLGAAMEDCRRVAGAFPASLHVGIDLLVSAGLRKHAILEANAFGDLLPGLQYRGHDTYTAEILALCNAWESMPCGA
jgi:hypothetical protein